jgi:hypothetical protein
VTLAEPEVDDGAEEDDELLVPELLVPEDELLPESSEPAFEDDDPELDLADEPDVPDTLDALDVLCVELGRVKASPPATARPSTPAPAVAARSRPRARSRATTAVTVRGSLLFIMSPSRKLAPLTFPQRSVAGLSHPSAAPLNAGFFPLAVGRRFPLAGRRVFGPPHWGRTALRSVTVPPQAVTNQQGAICRISRSVSAKLPPVTRP